MRYVVFGVFVVASVGGRELCGWWIGDQ